MMIYDKFYKPKVLIFSLLILLIIFFTSKLILHKASEEKNAKEHLIISSGSVGGNYNKAGEYIERTLNKLSSDNLVFKSIPSGGSLNNIERLKSRFTDFAIVQRDVLLRNYFGPGEKLKNVTVITPLFQEKFIIYNNYKEDIAFDEFKKSISDSKHSFNIGLTKLDGTSHKTFVKIASLLGLPLNNINFIEGNYSNLIDMFSNNKLDYLMTFSLPLETMEANKIKKVYFTDEQVNLLTGRMNYFSQALLDDNKKTKTIGVWAVLIGLNYSVDKVQKESLIKGFLSYDEGLSYISRNIHNTVVYFKSNIKTFNKYFSSLPVVDYYTKKIENKGISLTISIVFLLFMLTLIFIYYKYINSNSRKWNYIWLRYNHIIIGVIVIILLYILSIEYLIYSERIFYYDTSTKSRILDLTRTDLHVWNIVRIFAQNDGGIFPLSLFGKMVTTLSSYVLFFGATGIVTAEFVIRAATSKRRKGLQRVKYMKQVVISGWNSNTPRLINELLSAAKNYHKQKFKIVCVVQDPNSILNNDLEVSTQEYEKKITFIKGDLRNKQVAERCNAHNALAIILLAEDNTVNSDEKTLMRALSVNRYNCMKRDESLSTGVTKQRISDDNLHFEDTRDAINTTYIIAEVNNEDFVEDLQNAGVNGIVDRGKIIEGVLVQSLLNRGVSTLLNNILSFSGDTNEFYTVDLRKKKNKHLVGKTFDDLLLPLRKNNILLIAIKVVYLDKAGKEIVDTNEIDEKLENDGLTRQIITNPITKNETIRKTDGDDQLIVLSTDIDRLNKAIKRVTFSPLTVE